MSRIEILLLFYPLAFVNAILCGNYLVIGEYWHCWVFFVLTMLCTFAVDIERLSVRR